MEIEKKLEAILFWKGEPVNKNDLQKILNINSEELEKFIINLDNSLKDRGVCIVNLGDEISMNTSSSVSDIIEKMTKEEIVKDLGKAGLETLSIILYKGKVTRAEIDYIRGVNSQFIVRNLLIRGLIGRKNNPNDSRSYEYFPTINLLSHLGLKNLSDLPDYERIRQELDKENNEENKG